MALQYRFEGNSIEISMCLYGKAQCNGGKQCFVESKNYLSLGIMYFDVFKERRPKDHYIEKITIFKGKHCNFKFWRLQPHWWLGKTCFPL
jgi:hypothetical protein